MKQSLMAALSFRDWVWAHDQSDIAGNTSVAFIAYHSVGYEPNEKFIISIGNCLSTNYVLLYI